MIMLTKCNPTTRVNVDDLIEKLKKLNLRQFKNNVPVLLDRMQETLDEITDKKGKYETFEKLIFTQLLKHPHQEFKTDVLTHSKN